MAALDNLIKAAYSPAEVRRHLSLGKGRDRLDAVAAVGREILEHVPLGGGTCAHLSALWTAQTRDRLGVPAYCVAGDLLARGRVVFGVGRDDLSTAFDNSNPAWDGHCWMHVGGFVGDLSVFRTAYSAHAPKALRDLVLARFGEGRGLYLATPSAAEEDGLSYVAKYVLTETQITGLVLGAREMFAPGEPPNDS